MTALPAGSGPWDDWLLFDIDHGMTDAEVIDAFVHSFPETTLFMQRQIRDRVAFLRRTARPSPEVTAEEVRAMEAELAAAGKDHGIGSLSKALKVSEATIRRRLGRL